MENKLVSIIMPFKNTSQYLPDCINSIINQQYTNWELIATDDNSSDDSFEVLSSFAEKDIRIKVLKNKGEGIIPALQTSYNFANGEYITRMDSDDMMSEEKLLEMVTQLEKNGKGNVALGLVKYFSSEGIADGYRKYESWINNLTLTGGNFDEIYKECVIASPCWMVYKTDFDNCGGFNSVIYPEDYDLTFRFYQNKLKCLPTDKLLHYWRDYSTRTSRTNEHYLDSSFIKIKLYHFLKTDYDTTKNLVIWGAGKKGKYIANQLVKKRIPFYWICDNPNKIGKKVYGEELLPFTFLEKIKNTQSVVTVANSEAQAEIRDFLSKQNLQPLFDYYFFC